MTITPRKIYQDRVKDGTLEADVVQSRAVSVLQRLFDEILEAAAVSKQGFFKRLSTRISRQDARVPRGVYLYGGVGRGKSMLMDLFYDALPDDLPKRRVHFHEFMVEVHDYIHSRTYDEGGVMGRVDQALPTLADLIARKSRILCFDEFHVVDIADAMILGRLFKVLFEANVIVVATSNWAPDDLYKDGLQRERFLPFIERLKERVVSVHLDSAEDYRTQKVQVEGTYFTPLGSKTQQALDDIFESLVGGLVAKSDVFTVKGRQIAVDQTADGVARFSFVQLCERPHGAEDYLEIARRYHTVFLEKIPKLGYDRRNEIKRLMNLIDALYEARVRVIISAAAPVEKLYVGRDHAYEFERTVSRILEMQSADYP